MGNILLSQLVLLCQSRFPSWTELHRELFPETEHVFKNYTNPYNLQPVFNKFPHSNLTPEFFFGLLQILQPTPPRLIVEVGSLYGNSVLTLSTVLDEVGYPAVPIICIDPWSGDLNMLLARHKDPVVRAWSSPVRDGRALTFDQFMVNVQFAMTRGSVSPFHVIPLHATSIVGARWLKAMDYTPDIIFIDSAHEEDETLLEIRSFYEVLAPGGIIFGDDYGWTGVRNDVQRFAASKPEIDFQIRPAKEGVRHDIWVMRKPKI